ncbi:hypothetical protein G6F59_015555 [Rhizopus arrhizus]|nr:hypothetical protein G6F59_015555 [Rhizopus arrhizus]
MLVLQALHLFIGQALADDPQVCRPTLVFVRRPATQDGQQGPFRVPLPDLNQGRRTLHAAAACGMQEAAGLARHRSVVAVAAAEAHFQRAHAQRSEDARGVLGLGQQGIESRQDAEAARRYPFRIRDQQIDLGQAKTGRPYVLQRDVDIESRRLPPQAQPRRQQAAQAQPAQFPRPAIAYRIEAADGHLMPELR